jgi:hypothetical protein
MSMKMKKSAIVSAVVLFVTCFALVAHADAVAEGTRSAAATNVRDRANADHSRSEGRGTERADTHRESRPLRDHQMPMPVRGGR